MARPSAPHSTDPKRAGLQGAPAQPGQQVAPKGWPFAQGSQNHLDETSAPWPRPSRPAAGKPSGHSKPGQ